METCSWCGKKVRKPNYISLVRGDERVCRNCHTPGFRTDGILTRTSERLREQRKKHSADLVQPHTYDKSKGKLIISPDFVRLYPDKIRYYATEEQIEKEGYPELARAVKRQKEIEGQMKEKIREAEFEGRTEGKIEEYVKK